MTQLTLFGDRYWKKNKMRSIVLSVLCGPSSLFVSQRLSVPKRSCSIALVWALDLPWGVWVLQHKTVNPPVSWCLLIRYSHPASCPGKNSSGLPSPLSLIIPLSLFTFALLPASPHTNMTAYSVLCRIQAQPLAFFLASPQLNKHCASAFVYPAAWLSSLLSLTLCLFHFLLSVIFSSSLCLISSLSPSLTCHSRPVSLKRKECCGCNCHPLRERGSVLWLRVIPDHDNVCRWASWIRIKCFPSVLRPKLSWPGIHLNLSVTPVAKRWVSSAGEPSGINKQTKEATLGGVQEQR